MPTPDIKIEQHGNVVEFRMLSRKAVNWMVDSLHYESWQMLGANVLCIDHRYADDIMTVARTAGLTVEISDGQRRDQDSASNRSARERTSAGSDS